MDVNEIAKLISKIIEDIEGADPLACCAEERALIGRPKVIALALPTPLGATECAA